MEERVNYRKAGLIISLVAISYITTEIGIILVRFNSDLIIKFVDNASVTFINGIVIASSLLMLGMNYYLLDRKFTGRETFFMITKFVLLIVPVSFLTSESNIFKLIENKNRDFIMLYEVASTVAFYILYSQIIKLVKNFAKYYKATIAEKEDRLTIAITIIGVIISLIALFRWFLSFAVSVFKKFKILCNKN